MTRTLVAYATMSGSTLEVAEAIGKEITAQGVEVDVGPLEPATDLAGYGAVVIGAPMIMGWHRCAIGFLIKHRHALEHTPLTMFATAMSLVTTGETTVKGVPVYVDPILFDGLLRRKAGLLPSETAAKVVVMLAVEAQPGDRRNWEAISTRAAGVPSLFNAHAQD